MKKLFHSVYIVDVANATCQWSNIDSQQVLIGIKLAVSLKCICWCPVCITSKVSKQPFMTIKKMQTQSFLKIQFYCISKLTRHLSCEG